MLTSAGCFESQALSLTTKTFKYEPNYYRAEARRIANFHWFAHARVELETTYAAPVINIYINI